MRIFGPKRDNVTGERRKLRNEELNDLYSSPNIIGGDNIEHNEMGGACSTMGRGEAYTEFWWGTLRERDNLEDPGAYKRIILGWIFMKWDVGVWTGSSWLKVGKGGWYL
jgi:hypothetical protein